MLVQNSYSVAIMARPREFNEQEALDRAMEVFWRKGYRNASTEDLMGAMGIQRGSFYNTFGSKRETYLRALERYRQMLGQSGGPYAPPSGTAPGVETLREVLGSYLGHVFDRETPPGCFFLHVSGEHRGTDPEIRAELVRGVERMRALLGAQVAEAQKAGELPAHLEPEATALMFMAVAWGLNMLAEAGLAEGEIRQAASTLFSLGRSPV